MKITLITGGAPHYEAGLVSGLVEQGVELDVIGGADLASAPIMRHSAVSYKLLHTPAPPGSSRGRKLLCVLGVYLKLIRYAAGSRAKLFHIQWPYKLVFLDRTLLNLYYKILGKKLVFTAHNVDGDARDGKQSGRNKFSLKFLYRIVDHIIAHTNKMRDELGEGFGVPAVKVSVIPHGIMSAVPETSLTRSDARRQLGLAGDQRVILAFGLITPYKGLEYLVSAVGRLRAENKKFTLLIAGRVKECQDYWDSVCALIEREGLKDSVIVETKHIPDELVEVYFKAADVLAMPYRSLFQSGVLFLTFRFGLPVIATDVGSLKEDIADAKAGFICKVDDAADLAKMIEEYFASDLYRNLEQSRQAIRAHAFARYSWSNIGKLTHEVYKSVLAQ